MQLPDYYAVLDVPKDATLEQIKRSYRRLARRYHPDLNKQTEDVHIKQLNEAYDVLSDFAKRAAYDIYRLEDMRRQIMLEALLLQRRKVLREMRDHKMTWREGMSGFVREFKKGLRDE